MVSVKLLLAGVEVILVFILALLVWSSFTWIRAYLKNRSEMQNALYDSTSTEEELELLYEKEDESKRNIQFSIAFSIIIVVLLFGFAMLLNTM